VADAGHVEGLAERGVAEIQRARRDGELDLRAVHRVRATNASPEAVVKTAKATLARTRERTVATKTPSAATRMPPIPLTRREREVATKVPRGRDPGATTKRRRHESAGG
jgi:hypothetical protein